MEVDGWEGGLKDLGDGVSWGGGVQLGREGCQSQLSLACCRVDVGHGISCRRLERCSQRRVKRVKRGGVTKKVEVGGEEELNRGNEMEKESGL